MPILPLAPVSNARPSATVASELPADRRSVESCRDKYRHELQIVRMTGRRSIEAYWENVIGELRGADPDLVKSYMRPTVSSIVKRNRGRLEGIPECQYESDELDDDMYNFIHQWLEDSCPSECDTEPLSESVVSAVPPRRFSEAESMSTDEFQKLVRGTSSDFLALINNTQDPQDPENFSFLLHEVEQHPWPKQVENNRIPEIRMKPEMVQTGEGIRTDEGDQTDFNIKCCNPWGKVFSFAAGAGAALGLVLLKG